MKKPRLRRKELEAIREGKEELSKEIEKEWKREEMLEGYEEKKKAMGYEHQLMHRSHIKDSFIKRAHLGRVRGKPTHIRRNRHGRMVEKTGK